MTSGGLLAAKIAEAERAALHEVLTQYPKHQHLAALRLGVCKRTLQALIARHGYPDELREARRRRVAGLTQARRAAAAERAFYLAQERRAS